MHPDPLLYLKYCVEDTGILYGGGGSSGLPVIIVQLLTLTFAFCIVVSDNFSVSRSSVSRHDHEYVKTQCTIYDSLPKTDRLSLSFHLALLMLGVGQVLTASLMTDEFLVRDKTVVRFEQNWETPLFC